LFGDFLTQTNQCYDFHNYDKLRFFGDFELRQTSAIEFDTISCNLELVIMYIRNIDILGLVLK
jgi:hypothetical protein